MKTGPNGELLNNAGQDVMSPDYKGSYFRVADIDNLRDYTARILNHIKKHPDQADKYIDNWFANCYDEDGESWPESSSPEQIQDLEKELGTQGDNSDTGTPYQSREDVPESARDLWDIMHNDEAINSMRRGM